MKIGFLIFAIYAALTLALVTRFGKSKKAPKRITGRGGDFEA
jgi:hypothetical protein